MDEATLQRIERGKAIRLVLEQRQYQTMSAVHQIAIFTATISGLFDGLDDVKNKQAQHIVCDAFDKSCAKEQALILNREKLSDENKQRMLDVFTKALQKERILP